MPGPRIDQPDRLGRRIEFFQDCHQLPARDQRVDEEILQLRQTVAGARGQLVAVLEKFKPQPQPIWLVYPQARHLSPKVRAFVDFMVEKFKPR